VIGAVPRSSLRASDSASGVDAHPVVSSIHAPHARTGVRRGWSRAVAGKRIAASLVWRGRSRIASRARRASRSGAAARGPTAKGSPLPRGWASAAGGGGTACALRAAVVVSDAMGRGGRRLRSPCPGPAGDASSASEAGGGHPFPVEGAEVRAIRAHPAVQGGSIHSLTEAPSRTRPHRVDCRAGAGRSPRAAHVQVWPARRGRASLEADFGRPLRAVHQSVARRTQGRGPWAQEQPIELPQLRQR
jgi:hypothetical protein